MLHLQEQALDVVISVWETLEQSRVLFSPEIVFPRQAC